MKHFLFTLLLLTNTLSAGWFDFFSWGDSKTSRFECPYHCGEFGSPSLLEVEKNLFNTLSGIYETDDYDFDRDPKMHFTFYEFMGFQTARWEVTADSGGHIFERFHPGDETDYSERYFTLHIPWSIHDAKVCLSECLYCVQEGGNVQLRKDLHSPNLLAEGAYKIDRVPPFFELLRLIESDALACCMVEFYASDKTLLKKESIKDHRSKIRFYQRKIEKFGTHLIKDSTNNTIDLNHEIERLERSIEFCEKEFERLLAIDSEKPIRERHWRDNRRTTNLLPALDQARTTYTNIHKKCAETHKAPSAFYNLALMQFYEGDHLRALENLNHVFEQIDLEALEAHQASNICETKGTVENQLALYESAILSLDQAIEKSPQNKEAYFERAIAYFEQGHLQEAIEDFLTTGYATTPLDPNDTHAIEFAKGLLKGTATNSLQSLIDFVPSTFHTLSGLSHGLWAFACDPVDVSQELITSCQNIAQFIKDNTTLEIAQTLIPELRELTENWDHLAPTRKGELMGSIIGEYGTDFLLIAYATKGASIAFRSMKAFSELRRANAALTLERLAYEAATMAAIEEQHLAWWNKTKPLIDKIKQSNGKGLDKLIAKEFKNHPLSELQIRQILHQCGIKTFPKPKGIPENWTVKLSKENGGMKYRLETLGKDGQTWIKSEVRVMPGNANSSWSAQQSAYVKHNVNGKYLDKKGNIVKRESPEAHIPLNEYDFEKISKLVPYE